MHHDQQGPNFPARLPLTTCTKRPIAHAFAGNRRKNADRLKFVIVADRQVATYFFACARSRFSRRRNAWQVILANVLSSRASRRRRTSSVFPSPAGVFTSTNGKQIAVTFSGVAS